MNAKTVFIIVSNLVCFFAVSTLAEIQHTGFLGGPFHGVSRDASGKIVNQAGPTADLVDTIGLVANVDISGIVEGESAHLQAALRLDDGTITRLNPLDVEWSSESDQLSITDGLVTARNVAQRTKVAILASADGYSATVFLRLKPGQTPEDAVDQLELPQALANAVDLELPVGNNQNGLVPFTKEKITGFTMLNMVGFMLPAGMNPVLGFGAPSRNGFGLDQEFILIYTAMQMPPGFILWYLPCPAKFIIIIQLKSLRKKTKSASLALLSKMQRVCL